MTSPKISPEFLNLTPEQKRLCAALYWMGVCVGELVALGVEEKDVRLAFERAFVNALGDDRPIGEMS